MNENKKDIAALLSEEIVFQTPTGKIIVTTGGLQMKMVLNSNDNKIDLSGLKASHQEAVTRIVLHAIHPLVPLLAYQLLIPTSYRYPIHSTQK